MENETKTDGVLKVEGSANNEVDAAPKMIKWEDHKRVLDDMHKFKKTKAELEAHMAKLESDRLKEKEDWKTVAERAEKERDEYKASFTGLKENLVKLEKYKTVESFAKKAGLRTEAERDLGLLNLDGVEIETTSEGRAIVHHADTFVENLKKERPHWFSQKAAPKVNSGGSTTIQESELTPDLMSELYLTNKKKYQELMPKFLRMNHQK